MVYLSKTKVNSSGKRLDELLKDENVEILEQKILFNDFKIRKPINDSELGYESIRFFKDGGCEVLYSVDGEKDIKDKEGFFFALLHIPPKTFREGHKIINYIYLYEKC